MTKYLITYLDKEGNLKHCFTNRIIKARKFISLNFSSVLSCWREINRYNKSSSERIFR